MSMEKRRDEIGKLLACLLVSRKETSSIRDLERDYRENEGRNIPYKEFGCLNSLDFFRSISRHIRIEPGPGIYWVYPVVSDKIKHVNDLVSRQRPAKRHTPVRRRPSRTSRYFPQVRDPKPFVPNGVQQEIAKILKANPNGVNKSYIAQCLEHSRAIAGTVNVNNIDEYVSSMPYTAVTRGNLIYPSQCLKATINAVKREVEVTDGFRMVTPRNSETLKETLSRNINAQVTTHASYPAGSEQDEDIYDDFSEQYEAPPILNLDDNYAANNDHHAQQSLTTDNDNRPRMSSAEFIDRAGFQYTQSQSQCELPRQNNNAEENNCYQNGERLEVKENGEQEENCQDDNAASTFISDDDDDSIDIISSRIKSRLQQLIQKNPDGIWCADLPQAYLDEFKVPLDYTDLGYGSVCELASNIPKVFRLHRQNNRGDFMLYDASKPLPPLASKPESSSNSDVWENSLYDDDVDPFPLALPLLTSQSLVPKGVMTLGESVGQERIPDISTGITECLEIYVVEVYTPSLFWIQLRKKRSKLSQLMRSMDEFYRQEGDCYTIPHVILEKGLNCVCPFEDKWHRAIIKTVKPDGDVTLIFYDYGTTKTCPPDALRFLVREYSNLPAQAIACGLYNVKPLNANAWTRGVSSEFYYKVADTPLIAMVVKVDTENNSMLVSLADTHGETDIHINDWLVESGMAEPGIMVRSRPSNFVFKHYLACTNHHYEMSLKKQKLRKTSGIYSKLKSNNRSDGSKSELSSKVELKSANYLRSSIMARCSKYYKESQVNPTADIADVSAGAQGSSSTYVSKWLKHGSNLMEYREKNDRSLERKAESYNRRINKNEKHNDDSSSISAQSLANSGQVSGDSNSHKASEGRVLESPKDEHGGKLEFSGTFRSFYGGHGSMEPIDWDIIRNDVKLGEETLDTKKKSKSQAIAESPEWKLYEEDAEQSGTPERIDKCSDDLPKESLHYKMISDDEEVTDVKSVKKKEKPILPTKDSFLNAVQSNEAHYYSLNGEKLLWSPDGNIEDKEGVITPLLRTRKKYLADAHIDLKNVYASPETSKILRENELQNTANGTICKDLSNLDIDSIAQLKKEANHVDTAGISNPSKITNIQTLITPTKISSKTSTSSNDYNCQFAGLKATPQSIEENGETRNSILNTRITTVLKYIDSRKKRNIDSISTENSPSSNAAIHPNNLQTLESSSVSLNKSRSSIAAGKKPDSQKASCASLYPDLNYFKEAQKNSTVLPTQKSSNVKSSIKNSDSILSENVPTVSPNVHSSFKSTDSERDSLTSENREIASRSDDSSEHKDKTKIAELNKSIKKFYPTLSKIQIETSTTADTMKAEIKIPVEVSSSDTTIHNAKPDLEISSLQIAGKESSKSQFKSCIYSKLYESTASELDSDDLSRAYSDLENSVLRTAKKKIDAISTKNNEPDLLDGEKTTATLRAPSSDDNTDTEFVNDNMALDPDDNKEIEHYVSQNKSEFFSPIVNDVDSMAESDEWEVNGNWREFMEDNGELMTRVIDKLQIANNSSRSKAQLVEITDKSELENAFYKNVHNHEEMDEEICEKKIGGVGTEGSCDIYDKNYTTNVQSVESSRSDSTEQSELISNERTLTKNIRTNHRELSQLSCSNVPIRALNRKKADISIDEISDNFDDQKLPHVGSSTEISKRKISHTPVEETLGTRVIKSKTNSMLNMLENLKSKRNPLRLNSDFKTIDGSLYSVKDISATRPVSEINENVEFAIDSSTEDEISEELDTKQSESLSESGMFADLSNSSSSSKCSETFIPNTMTQNETDSKDIRHLKNRKSRRVLPGKYSISNQESQTSSSDAIVEFIEEPTELCAQFPILSRVKKQHLSVKSNLKDVGVGRLSEVVADSVREKDSSILNESSESSSSLSKSLLDRIKFIYSKKN